MDAREIIEADTEQVASAVSDIKASLSDIDTALQAINATMAGPALSMLGVPAHEQHMLNTAQRLAAVMSEYNQTLLAIEQHKQILIDQEAANARMAAAVAAGNVPQ